MVYIYVLGSVGEKLGGGIFLGWFGLDGVIEFRDRVTFARRSCGSWVIENIVSFYCLWVRMIYCGKQKELHFRVCLNFGVILDQNVS